ncbi:MFS transporter [Streptomyces sp. L06]|nr:MFS transporter [Streptomyces sp. L06]
MDQVNAEAALADALGIQRWHTVIGMSIGGARALEWAVSRPDRVGRLLLIAVAAATRVEQAGHTHLEMELIRRDPHFHAGEFYHLPQGCGPRTGVALARSFAHLRYGTERYWQDRFGGQTWYHDSDGVHEKFREYVLAQGDKVWERFDANCNLVLSETALSTTVARGRGSIEDALARVTAPTHIVGFSTDRAYPPRASTNWPQASAEPTRTSSTPTSGTTASCSPPTWSSRTCAWPSGRGGPVLAVLLVGAFMPTLDFFIVNVAVPSMTEDLRATSGEIELVVAVYAIVYAGLVVLGGRLGDHWGRKKAFVVGTALFTITSAMCAAAPDVWWLICARALQGAAAVVLFPQVLALIQLHYPPATRPRAMRAYGLATGGAMATGQLIGGVLISLDWLGLSWRWAFLINLPVGLVTLALAPLLLPATSRLSGLRFDRTGVLLFATGMAMLVVPLTAGRSAGWPAWTLLMLLGAALLLPAFWLWERRAEALGHDVLLPPACCASPPCAPDC